jgi:hypothetical protein
MSGRPTSLFGLTQQLLNQNPVRTAFRKYIEMNIQIGRFESSTHLERLKGNRLSDIKDAQASEALLPSWRPYDPTII